MPASVARCPWNQSGPGEIQQGWRKGGVFSQRISGAEMIDLNAPDPDEESLEKVSTLKNMAQDIRKKAR